MSGKFECCHTLSVSRNSRIDYLHSKLIEFQKHYYESISKARINLVLISSIQEETKRNAILLYWYYRLSYQLKILAKHKIIQKAAEQDYTLFEFYSQYRSLKSLLKRNKSDSVQRELIQIVYKQRENVEPLYFGKEKSFVEAHNEAIKALKTHYPNYPYISMDCDFRVFLDLSLENYPDYSICIPLGTIPNWICPLIVKNFGGKLEALKIIGEANNASNFLLAYLSHPPQEAFVDFFLWDDRRFATMRIQGKQVPLLFSNFYSVMDFDVSVYPALDFDQCSEEWQGFKIPPSDD